MTTFQAKSKISFDTTKKKRRAKIKDLETPAFFKLNGVMFSLLDCEVVINQQRAFETPQTYNCLQIDTGEIEWLDPEDEVEVVDVLITVIE